MLDRAGVNVSAVPKWMFLIFQDNYIDVNLIFVTGLVKFVTAVARLVCLELLGYCLSLSANIYFGPSISSTKLEGLYS